MAIPADKLAAEAAEAESESAGRRWTDHVARTTAVLAVLAAVASGAYANQFSQTILSQTEASDQWSYYQAKSIKKHISTGQLEMERALAAGRPELVPALAQLEAAASATAKRYDAELAGIKARAETLDATKARHQKQGDRFQFDCASISEEKRPWSPFLFRVSFDRQVQRRSVLTSPEKQPRSKSGRARTRRLEASLRRTRLRARGEK